MRQEITYQIYSPCGNDTALVEGINFSQALKKTINDEIMKREANVEQVGFVDNVGTPKLIMAGGEFCGNASRCAAYQYLKGLAGEIRIEVSGAEGFLKVGVDEAGNAWSQMPIDSGDDVITALEPGIDKVKMKGIIHIIVEVEQARPYLEDKKRIKESAMKIIKRNLIEQSEAVGVIFLEEIDQQLKIHPVVWVKSIDTLFYETSCGSGTVALGILKSMNLNASQDIDVLQPSGQIIHANITMKKGKLADAIISGKVLTDGVLRKLEVGGSALQQVGR
jgi:diaminopimelate epimerase